MLGSAAPCPSAAGSRRGRHLCIWLLLIVGSAWVGSPNIGLAGPEGRGGGPLRCRQCRKWAVEQVDGSYKCKDGHRFFPGQGDGGDQSAAEGRKKKGKRKK
jgi:hypothetical protein